MRYRPSVRVVHRRSLLTRPKVIHSMSTEYINQHFFTLHLTTSAGACACVPASHLMTRCVAHPARFTRTGH